MGWESHRVLVVWCPEWAAGQPGGQGTAQDGGTGARAFEPVVAAVAEFCPRVEVLRPGACAFGARGPARYFGGEQALAGKIIAAVGRLGYRCQAGAADGLFAAWLAARAATPAGLLAVAAGQAREFLARLPVTVLADPWLAGAGAPPGRAGARPAAACPDGAELAELLPRLGIRTLGEFAALPAAAAANRFGAAGSAAHRLARGLPPRPVTPRAPPADHSVCARFNPPAAQAEPVIFAAKGLAERLHAGLAASGLACVRVRITAVGTDGREISRRWRHDGLLSALAVAERVRWQLAGWRDGQGPGDASGRPGPASDGAIQPGGITLLRLVPDQLVRATGRQLGLWGDAAVSDRLARAAVQVQALLGQGAVTRPLLAGGRSPGEQVTPVPFGDHGEPERPAGRPWPGQIPAPAPATVYPEPRPARVTDDTGGVVTVTGRALVSAPPARLVAGDGPALAVTGWAGPWPADERWWDPAGARRRARLQLVTEDGSGWLVAVAGGCWLVEARYD
ncbi:MAG TPA: DNA polymerase Y family protein [Streptosporangiaceae bacterium]|jgi:protein ImuB|nr:DNA polymerase Y family protein [Streptosporangiaceae bacterium]